MAEEELDSIKKETEKLDSIKEEIDQQVEKELGDINPEILDQASELEALLDDYESDLDIESSDEEISLDNSQSDLSVNQEEAESESLRELQSELLGAKLKQDKEVSIPKNLLGKVSDGFKNVFKKESTNTEKSKYNPDQEEYDAIKSDIEQEVFQEGWLNNENDQNTQAPLSSEQDGLFVGEKKEVSRFKNLQGKASNSIENTKTSLKNNETAKKVFGPIKTVLDFVEKGVDKIRKNPKTSAAIVAGLVIATALTGGGAAVVALGAAVFSAPVIATAAVYVVANAVKNRISPSEVYKANQAKNTNENSENNQQHEEQITRLDEIKNTVDDLQNEVHKLQSLTEPGNKSALSETNVSKSRHEKNTNNRIKNKGQKRRNSI